MPSLIISALCGLKDSVNPCNLLTAFVFFFMVSILRIRRQDVSLYAAIFLSAFFVCLFLSSLGVFSPIFSFDHVFFVVQKIYVMGGVVLLVCGFLHFRDWVWMKRNELHKPLFFPIIAGGQNAPRERVDSKLFFLIIFSVLILSILSSIWPQESYVAFNTSFILLPGKFLETYLMLIVYNFVLVLPMIGVFLLTSSQAYQQWVESFSGMIKILLSALTFGLGISLIYIFH